jgi:hypothetical protein
LFFADSVLTSQQLAEVLSFLSGDTLRGIFASAHCLPAEKCETYPSAFIIQTSSNGKEVAPPPDAAAAASVKKLENSNERHWVLTFFPNEECCFFFCSFGFSPVFYGLEEFVLRNANCYRYNSTRFQSFNSVMCGLFCSTILFFLISNFKFENVLNLLSPKDYIHNDNFCRSVYAHMLHDATPKYKAILKAQLHRGQGKPDCEENDENCHVCQFVQRYPNRKMYGF